MKSFGEKLTSRKFLACVAGIVTGIGLIASGNSIEGSTTVIASIVAYLVAEGYIDAKAVKQASQSLADKIEIGVEDDKLL